MAATTGGGGGGAGANMPATHLVLKEEDVVKLACEFMQNRALHISQVTLERESGVINGNFSDDMLFLRQLILDGQWEDILEFIQPLATLSTFDHKLFQFTILKAKFIELLCIKGEAPIPSPESAVDTVVDVLKEIEQVAPSKEHYSNLCLLLTLNKLSDHPDYRSWNPSKGRIQCFKEVLPLVQELLGGEKKNLQRVLEEEPMVASNDRLLQLIIKGILYESCVDYCQQKATGSKQTNQIEFTNLLSQSDFSDSDLSLLSWLQSIPSDTFACPFEQKSLNVDVERIKAPHLDTSWTEHMLITPIKPNIFPHSAMPTTRPKGTDIMTKSLNMAALAASIHGGNPSSSSTSNSGKAGGGDTNGSVVDMSKSLASFHLTGGGGKKVMMDASVDQLFKDGESIPPHHHQNESAHQDKQKTHLVSEYHRQKLGHAEMQPTTQIITTQQDHQRSNNNNNHDGGGGSRGMGGGKRSNVAGPPRFLPVCSFEDVQAIRCAEFHPNGRIFAVGSNSKTLRVCQYPQMTDLREDHDTYQTTVLFKRNKHHKGSIYCLAWSPTGELIATGSNDKTVKVMRFNADSCSFDGAEMELSMHDGTVRDCLFMSDLQTLVSGGAGDCKIHLTDCATGQTVHSMVGHSGHVLTLCTWGGSMFASGSQDKTVRFWDLRSRGCVNMVQYHGHGPPQGSPVAACTVDPSGRLLVTGHEDATCILYDVRGGRNVQTFKPHTQDVRSIRFSPNAYYLLSGGYDNRIVLTDLQGDLTQPLPSVVVAQHQDKVISGRWHPTDFSYLSTSADKTCTLWGLPPV